jgi:tetratricopeptide (TPR) repeat protein
MQNIRLIWLLAIAALIFEAKPAACQDKPDAKQGELNYQYGVQCYRLKRYNEAAGYFSQAIKLGQYGASLLLYQGHSYFACGRTSDAVEAYKRIIEAFPTAPEAAVARQSLSKISPQALTSKSSAPAVAATKPLLERIEIVRPVISHPELQQSTIRTVKETVAGLPPKIKAILDKGGINFCLTTTLIDKLPGLGYEEAGGYDGGTYKSCPGMFWKNTIYICERTVNEADDSISVPRSGEDIRGTVLHEIGHALDSCLDDYSESEEYRHAYYLDIAQVSDSMAPRIKYYLQKSVAGQNESCGELTSILLGNSRRNDEDLQACFPNTMKVIKKKLGL